MRSLIRPLLITLMLTLWTVSGPVGMAFDGCAMMGAMCEAPCGVVSYISGPVVTGLAVPPTARLSRIAGARSTDNHQRPASHTAAKAHVLLRLAF